MLALDAATYAVFVVCLLAMRAAAGSAARSAPATRRDGEGGTVEEAPVGKGIGPAVRFILGAPAIVATTLMYMCLNISGGISLVVIPVYALNVLGGGAATYGVLLSALTAGELIGLLVIGAVAWPWALGRSIAAGALLSGVILSLLLLRPQLPVILLVLAASGLAESSLTPWAQTIRMRLIPPALRGRVFALLRTLMQSTRPIGAVLAGVLLAGGDLDAGPRGQRAPRGGAGPDRAVPAGAQPPVDRRARCARGGGRADVARRCAGNSVPNAIPDVGRVGGLERLEDVELDRLPEAVEEPLARAEDDRRDRDRELVDDARGQRLPDDVGAAHDVDVLVAGRLAGPRERLVEAVHEREPGPRRAASSGRWVTMKNGTGHGLSPPQCPAAS